MHSNIYVHTLFLGFVFEGTFIHIYMYELYMHLTFVNNLKTCFTSIKLGLSTPEASTSFLLFKNGGHEHGQMCFLTKNK
jgi:hypothetical protein